MKRNYKMMPEQFYSLDKHMSLEKIIQAKNSGEPLVGKVILWNSKSKQLEVDLGNGYTGYIPFEHISIYPVLFPDGNLTHSIYRTIGNTILVSIINIIFDNGIVNIILSRKDIMLESFNLISNSIGKEIECCIVSFSSFGVFVDPGNGLVGMIHFQNLCVQKIKNFSDIGIKKGQKISAKILSVDDKFHVNLNYKDQFENLAFTLKKDDLVEAFITAPINRQGYFAYLNPVTSAVVDVPWHIPCRFGDKVIARVKGQRAHHPEQLKLEFVSFIKE